MTDGNKVYLLTENSRTKKSYLEMVQDEHGLPADIGDYILTLQDYISMHQAQFPELANFMGFQDEDEVSQVDQILLSEDQRLFEDHLKFEEMVLGVKEGKYFQGRLNISRLVQEEATVKVQGLSQEILIANLTDQNRALNGDIVCIQILPDDQWVTNFKATDQPNALLDDNQDEARIRLNSQDSQDEMEPENTNLIERINSETKMQVTGKVRGVLKKMNKTYGGSIINKKDMLASTLNKFKLYCQNHNISQSEEEKFRVFVPYNIQMPQCIVKS